MLQVIPLAILEAFLLYACIIHAQTVKSNHETPKQNIKFTDCFLCNLTTMNALHLENKHIKSRALRSAVPGREICIVRIVKKWKVKIRFRQKASILKSAFKAVDFFAFPNHQNGVPVLEPRVRRKLHIGTVVAFDGNNVNAV